MLRVNDKKILDYIPDYRIHLIDPARLTKEQLELFQTSLREVLGCIKYAKDKEGLKEYITENTRMYMENAAAQVIKAINAFLLENADAMLLMDILPSVAGDGCTVFIASSGNIDDHDLIFAHGRSQFFRISYRMGTFDSRNNALGLA